MKRWLPVLFLLIGVTSCGTLAPPYRRPPTPIPGQWPQGAAYHPAQGAVAPSPYWQTFIRDPHLRKIIKMALENNRDLRLAALNVARARAIYGVQRAELPPVVQVTASGGKRRNSADLVHPGEPRTAKQFSVDLGIVSWEIDFFGRIRSLEKQALEIYLSAEEARRSAQVALIAEVAQAYFTLAADQENLKLARATLKDQEASYALIRKRFDVGLANELDLNRAQTQVDAAERDIPRFTRRVARDKNALNLLAGATVPETLLPPGLEGIRPPKAIAPGLTSDVLLHRPDIVAAEHRLKAADAFIGAARAAFFPRITLTTQMGTASDELSGLFTAGTDTWRFIPHVTMPIFDPRTLAAYHVSKVQREIALTHYEKTIQTAFREVADALAVQDTIDREIRSQKSLVNAARQTYRLSLQRYTQGIDDYLSVLDAHRSLYFQQQVLTSLRLTRLANRVRLYAALGGGAAAPPILSHPRKTGLKLPLPPARPQPNRKGS